MIFGASVYFYMQLVWLYQNEKKMEKIVDVNICLPEITDFFIKETTLAGHTMQITQANNFEFGLMEIYKGVLFIGLS